jgi:hypothetical protein
VRENPYYDLLALGLVLTTATILLLNGVSPEAIAAVGATLTSLFAAWRRRHDRARRTEDDAGKRH